VKRALLLLLAVVVPAIAYLALSPPAGAAAGGRLELDCVIGGRDIDSADSTDPIEIDPTKQIPIRVTIRNGTDQDAVIRYVRLEGKALGLTFLTYDLGIRTTLDAGETTTVAAELDFFDLEDQATGYLGTSLRVYDPDRHVLTERSFVIDVRGKATSTLGLFALVVVAVAIYSTLILVLNTLRRRLPSNRFVRGVQFALAGGAIGVTLSLGVSILRVAFADVETWVPLVTLPTVIAFALGYLAPGPLSRSIRDTQEEEALQLAARAVVAHASGIHDPATSGRFDPRSGGFAQRSGGFAQRSGEFQRSGGFAQRSGEFQPDHSSGGFQPGQSSGEFDAARTSGVQEPVPGGSSDDAGDEPDVDRPSTP
jgi:hypothetical protein